MSTITKAAEDVLAERKRQIDAEGWTVRHDDQHSDGSLALAAACYASNAATWASKGTAALSETYSDLSPGYRWPWLRKWWKPKSPRQDLVRAAALLLAEIERLDRVASRTRPDGYPTWICKTCDSPKFCVSIQGCDREEMAR